MHELVQCGDCIGILGVIIYARIACVRQRLDIDDSFVALLISHSAVTYVLELETRLILHSIERGKRIIRECLAAYLLRFGNQSVDELGTVAIWIIHHVCDPVLQI